MTVEVTSRETLDPTIIEGDLAQLVQDLNMAAAAGRQFVIMQERNGGPVALETRNITRMREISDDDAFLGR